MAQEIPCPTVEAVVELNTTVSGGSCSSTVSFYVTNDVANNNPKGIRIEAYCGLPSASTLLVSQCFIAPTPGNTYFTESFPCCTTADVTIRVVRFTASNGNCQGGTCTKDFVKPRIVLPVTFKSFNAARNRSNVSLKWETASEQTNSGFAIERNTRGNWEQVAFVPTQAAGGNSDALLTYSLSDLNSEKGISQYRIKQIDIDAKSKYSEVRAVRGEGQAGKTTVYPNPSSNGRVNVVFEDATVTRDISVLDMSGRIVKQFRGVTNTISRLRT